jgi:hypothetical protein
MMRAFQGGNPQAAMQTLQPRLEEARQQLVDALASAEEILTEEQWGRIPPEVKDPPQITGMGGPGGQGNRGEMRQRLPGGGAGGAGPRGGAQRP